MVFSFEDRYFQSVCQIFYCISYMLCGKIWDIISLIFINFQLEIFSVADTFIVWNESTNI
jgi:hypothetical protein